MSSLWNRTTTSNQMTMSNLFHVVLIRMVVPIFVNPKASDGLVPFPQHTFDTIKKLLFLSVNSCPKGMHSTIFIARVVDCACVSVIFYQSMLIKAFIPIDVAEAIN